MPRATQLTIRRMECCNTANDRFRFGWEQRDFEIVF